VNRVRGGSEDLSIHEPLRELFAGAVKYIRNQEVALTERVFEDGVWWYHIEVGDYTVVIKVFRENIHPLRKEFSCTCRHGSLFAKENIPCVHILASLLFLGLGELYSEE